MAGAGKLPAAVVVAAAAVVLLLTEGVEMKREALEMCNMDAERLAYCLPAIRGPSPPAPSDSCCGALRTADLPCLCRYKGSELLRAAGVDPQLAAALPAKCNMDSPPDCTTITERP